MVIVYINEAHAADVWNIGESAGAINYSHKKIEDRINYAQEFVKKYDIKIPVYCDNINNEVETVFAAWPTRYFVVNSGLIKIVGEPNDSQFDFDDLFKFLKEL